MMYYPSKIKRGILLALLMLFAVSALSALTMNLNRPYHDSLSYAPGEPQAVTIHAVGALDFIFGSDDDLAFHVHSQKRAWNAQWELRSNGFRERLLAGSAEPEPSGGFMVTIPAHDLAPGFYDLSVTVDFGAGKATFPATFGYSIDSIESTYHRPDDFLDFWSRIKTEVDAVPLLEEPGPWQIFDRKAIENYLTSHAFSPANPDPEGVRFEKVAAQTVAFAGANGGRVFAQVAKPPVEGRLPAVLLMPGAGGWNEHRPFPLEAARHGYLAMDVSIHARGGNSVESDDPRRQHADFLMLGNALQSLRYLRSRPDVDPDQIFVAGMSQGGRLAIVLAALDDQIRAIVPSITHFADLPHRRASRGQAPTDGRSAEDYYDVLAFASEVTTPVFMSAGMVDSVSPVTGVHHAYRLMPSGDKTFVAMAQIAHFITPEFDRRAWRWIEERVPPAVGRTPSAEEARKDDHVK